MHKRTTMQEYAPNLAVLARTKRVCAYARVSGDRDEAFHSLSAQVSYYQKKIAEHPDWEFVEVFSDRGMPDKNIVFHLRNGCEEIVPLAEVR